MKNKPENLTEILSAATSAFKDPAVISVVIDASFGFVEVYRNGAMFHIDFEEWILALGGANTTFRGAPDQRANFKP